MRNRFVATEIETRKVISFVPNKYEKSAFLVMGPISRGSGADGSTIHTGAFIVENDGKSKTCKLL